MYSIRRCKLETRGTEGKSLGKEGYRGRIIRPIIKMYRVRYRGIITKILGLLQKL